MKIIRSQIPIILIALLGFSFAIYLYKLTLNQEKERLRALFKTETKYFVDAIQNRYSKYTLLLNSLSNFFVASDNVTPVEWKSYSEALNLFNKFPSIRFIAFVQIVPKSDQETFVQKMRASGLSDFKIWPESSNSTLFPIVYIYPQSNMNWIGTDLRETIESLPLLQDTTSESSLIVGSSLTINKIAPQKSGITLWYPIKKTANTVNAPNLIGWSMAFIDLNSMINNIASEVKIEQLNLQLFDEKGVSPENLILARVPSPDSNPLLVVDLPIRFGQKNWTIRFTTGPQYKLAVNYVHPIILSVAVSLATVLLIGLIYLLQKDKSRITKGEENEDNLNSKNRIYRSVFDSVDYAMIFTDPKGTIVLFNKAAEKMLGYKAKEMIGKQTPVIFHDPDEMESRAQELTQLFGKAIPAGFEVFVALAEKGIPDERTWSYIRKDKSIVPVNLRILKVQDENQTSIGYVGIAQYIK